MEFDKSRVYTALNADELEVGSKVIFADNLAELKDFVENGHGADTLVTIRSEVYATRFHDGYTTYALAYLIGEPEVKRLKWTDLKVGDVITNGDTIAMVTQIDKTGEYNSHIRIGSRWINDSDIEKWETGK